METKQQLLDFCETFVQKRISGIQENMQSIRKSMVSETKSSAGDKHETGRAMLQLELEKLGQQLAAAEKMQRIMLKVDIKRFSERISLGSWVKTSKGNYFLAISAGAFMVETQATFCISLDTPIGRLLLGKTVGDFVEFNGQKITITEIY